LSAAVIGPPLTAVRRNAHDSRAEPAKMPRRRHACNGGGRTVPAEKQVADWIEQAKALPPKIGYEPATRLARG